MDLVQEAFVKLWDTRQRVRPEQARPYVYKIALNMAANRRRAHKLWRWVGLEDRVYARDRSDEQLIRNQEETALRKAVERLPEKFKQVLVLCRFTDMSQREIGQLLKIPEGTVASRQHKALDLLKREMTRLSEVHP